MASKRLRDMFRPQRLKGSASVSTAQLLPTSETPNGNSLEHDGVGRDSEEVAIELTNESSAGTPKDSGASTASKLQNAIEPDTPPPEASKLSGWATAAVIAGLSLAVFCLALDGTILSTAIPKITAEFSSLHEMGWYVSAYSLALCSFSLVYGKIYTFYPVQWVYLFALAVFEAGSLICGAAPSSVVLIIGRAIAGLGGAGLLLGSMLIISEIMPLDKIPLCIGLLSGLYGIAGIVGPLLGGAFTDHLSWRWCFYINLPLGGVTALFVFFFVHLRPRKSQAGSTVVERFLQLDPLGVAVLIPAIISLLLVLQWGGAEYPWSNWRIILLLVLVGALTACFVAVQTWQGDRATIPGRLISNRNILCALVFIMCISGSQMVFTYYLPIWFQSIKVASATQSGIMNLPFIVGAVISSLLTGWAIGRIGYYAPFMYTTPIVAATGAGLLTTFTATHTGPAAWITYQLIFGIGLGMGMTLPIVVVQTALPAADVPTGTALITFTQTLAGTLFNFVAQNVFQKELASELGRAPLALGLDGATIARLTSVGPLGIRDVATAETLPFVLEAYNQAIIRTFYVGVGLAALAALGAIPIQWLSVKGKNMQKAHM